MDISTLSTRRESFAKKAKSIFAEAERANDGKGRALTLSERQDFDEAVDIVEDLTRRLQHEKNMNQIESRSNRERASITVGTSSVAPPPTYRDSAGNEVRMCSKGHFLSDKYVERNPKLEQFRGQNLVGRAIKEKVTGKNDDILNEYRVSSTSNNFSAGYLVDSFLSSELIDLARAIAVIARAGSRFLELPGEVTSFARLTADNGLTWKAQNIAFADTDATFDQITFTASTCGAVTQLSRELFADALNIEEAITNSLVASMAAEIDRVSLMGSTTDGTEPVGLNVYGSSTGINITTDVGASPTIAMLLQSRREILDDNYEPNAIVLSPRDDQGYWLLADTTTQPLRIPQAVDRDHMMWLPTSAVPITLGSGGAESVIFMGDFSNLWIGTREGAQVELSSDAAFNEHAVKIKLTWRGDVAVAQPSAFARIEGTDVTA